MLLLENQNRILRDTVISKLKTDNRDPVEVRICDFDDVQLKVFVSPEERNRMLVSMAVPCFAELCNDYNLMARLNSEYPGLMESDAQAGFDFTLAINLDNLSMPADELVAKLSMLKPFVMGSAFYQSFEKLRSEQKQVEKSIFRIRKDTTVYIFPAADRVTLIHSLEFPETSDQIIAKVFLQEFVEARRHVSQAPICTFSLTPPTPLTQYGFNPEEVPEGNFGFLTFAVLRNHVATEQKLNHAVNLLQGFRTYLQYHIKCSKAHFHQRMRARVALLLRVLNRAKMAPKEEDKKKTMSGRTFQRT